MKLFFLGKGSFTQKGFKKKEGKFFYVSPFVSLDSEFEFYLNPPQDGRINLRIDAFENGERVMVTTYTGKALDLTDLNLIRMFLKYPFVTLRVIGLIHWQALLLYLKKLPFIRKNEGLDKQRGLHLGRR